MEEPYEDNTLYFRQIGIFKLLPYTKSYKGDETKYVFYTGMNLDGSAGEYQLSAEIRKKTSVPVDDDEIVDAFIESLSKKILTDAAYGIKEYVGCLRTLPKGFYTERNVEHIIENVNAYSRKRAKTIKNEMQKQTYLIDNEIACCDLREYAHSQNHNVRKGTGREHLGE